MLSLNCQGCGRQFVSDSVGERHCPACTRASIETTGGPSIETTGKKFTPETMRRGIELMKAGDAKRRETPFPASETGEPVTPATETAYTVAERTFSGRETGRRVLVNADEIKAIMDGLLYVGQINSRQGDDSKPYAVFNKRDCAIRLAQLVNDRFNSGTAPSGSRSSSTIVSTAGGEVIMEKWMEAFNALMDGLSGAHSEVTALLKDIKKSNEQIVSLLHNSRVAPMTNEPKQITHEQVSRCLTRAGVDALVAPMTFQDAVDNIMELINGR